MSRLVPAGTTSTIRQAVSILRNGGVVAVPTDTVYGFVGAFDNEDAVRRIYELKGRSFTKALPLLLGTAVELPLVVSDVPDISWPLIYAFWPGALTIVFQAKSSVSSLLRANGLSVACRVPRSAGVLDILEAFSWPLASTSANISGQPALTSAGDVEQVFGSTVDLIVDGGEVQGSGMASTVLDITTKPFLVRRRGSITLGQLRDVVKVRVEIAPGA